MENLPQPEKERPEDAAANRDNSAHDEFENVANPMGPGSEDESGSPGQDGRNLRGFGSTDQDGANGVLRMNDQDNSTMEVTPEAEKSIAGSDAQTTHTATVAFTTAGPDDDASADETPVPAAEVAAKEAIAEDKTADDDTDANESDTNSSDTEQQKEKDIAQTGTSLNNQPTY